MMEDWHTGRQREPQIRLPTCLGRITAPHEVGALEPGGRGAAGGGHEQKTRSLGIHLNHSVRSYISEDFCIFPYLYMKIP